MEYDKGVLAAQFQDDGTAVSYQVRLANLEHSSPLLFDDEWIEDFEDFELERVETSPLLSLESGELYLPWDSIYYAGRHKIKLFAMSIRTGSTWFAPTMWMRDGAAARPARVFNGRFSTSKTGSVCLLLPQWIPSASLSGPRNSTRNLISMLVFGVFLSSFMSPAAAEVTFEQYEVVIGSAERQTVLTGFLLGGAMAELAVVNIDENDDRRLRIYAFGDSTWVAATRRNAASRSVVRRCSQHRRTRPLDCVRARPPELVRSRIGDRTHAGGGDFQLQPASQRRNPHVDVTRDVNGDERDDLVVPDVDGFWVFVQMSDGAFADPVKIGPSTDMSRIYGADGYRYDPWSQSRVHEIDYNRDGRSDLVFWNEDHFEVHLQDERGLFAPEAETFTTDVAFDSDDLSSLAYRRHDGEGAALANRPERRRCRRPGGLLAAGQEHCQQAFHLRGASWRANSRWRHRVCAGGRSHVPVGGSIQLGMDRHDFDRDGQVDLMFTTIEVDFLESSLWKRIKGFMGDDIWLDLEFYRMEGGRYPDTPNATRRIAVRRCAQPSGAGVGALDIVLRGGTHESRKTQEELACARSTRLCSSGM